MAIYMRCPKCKLDHKLDVKACRKCGANLKSFKKYKVVVKMPDGRRTVRYVGTVPLAKRVENSIKGKIAEKKLLNITESPFLSDIWDKYAAWAVQNKKDSRHDIGRWELHVAPRIKNKRMNQFHAHEVETVLDGMKKHRTRITKNGVIVDVVSGSPAPATKKQVLVLIKRVYNWSIKRGLYHGENPAANIEAPKINNQVTECLTADELKKLLTVLDSWQNKLAALVVKFALYTGMRLNEILGLEWKDVNLENNFVTLVDPKGNPVTLPVGGEAVNILNEALDNQPVSDCPYVFPNNNGGRRVSFGKIWSRIRKKAMLPDGFRFHGLRHTYASYLASSGEVDLYTLQKLLNHQDPKMTQRYAHLLDEALRKGADVASKVFGNGQGSPSP